MSRLVEDMLLLAQAGEDELPASVGRRAQAVPAASWSDGLADAAPRRLELGAIPELLVEADEDRLAQALRNLLQNAIAHTAEDGLVALGVEVGDGRVRFVVDDDGPGIPRRSARRGLRPLPPPRRRAARATPAGPGLGLAIVQAIATSHGGRVWAGCGAGRRSTTGAGDPAAGPSAAHAESILIARVGMDARALRGAPNA